MAVDATLSAAGPPFNPLVFHGCSGAGKSYLAQGLATELVARHPWKAVCRLSALDFARGFATLETEAVGRLRSSCRGADVFVLEDVHLLEGRETAQRELTLIFDELQARDAVMIFTSRHAPARLALQPALHSRLGAGLCVALREPEDAARAALIAQLAEQSQLRLPAAARQVLCRRTRHATAPQLRGILLALAAECRDADREITPQQVQRHLAARPRRAVTLRQIAVQTGRYFRITLAEMKSASRRRAVVAARALAMYLARRLTSNSLEQIGHYFGGRDHTTVLHNCRRVESRLAGDGGTQRAIDEVQHRLVAT